MARESASSASEITKNKEKKSNKRNNGLNDYETNSAIDQHHSSTISTSLKPPDGGWGWFVVLASFLIHIITDGITYSFGVFYLELLYYFEEGKGATAWIASILAGVTLCSGPISGSFVNKYGCRTVTIAGSILASACLLASVWASNIIMLYFSIGLGTGLGFGLIYLPAIVSVSCYFEKYRSLATGIAVCGSGLGTLVFAPCLESLITIYGWRGSMMICSGIILNCIVLGAFFRPLEPQISKTNRTAEDTSQESENLNKSGAFIKRQGRLDEIIDPESNIKFNTVTSRREVRQTGIRPASSQPVLITRTDSQSGSSDILRHHNRLLHGSLENIRNYFKSLMVQDEDEVLPLNMYPISLSTKIDIKKVETKPVLSSLPRKTAAFEEVEETSLFKNPVFILFTLSNFCTSIGFNVPYIYLLPQAEERGINKGLASYLLSLIGVANTLGRIILGYVSDKPWINRLFVYNICLTICGLATILSTFCTNFAAFTFYCITYGFTAGAYVGLTSVILVDLLGIHRLTSAFGYLLFFQGFATLLGPPIAGWLYDWLASYNPGFYTAGGMITISGLILFFIPMLQKKESAKQFNRRNAMNSET